MKPFAAILFLLATPAAAAAQVVGGGNKPIYQFDGTDTLDRIGTSISAAGVQFRSCKPRNRAVENNENGRFEKAQKGRGEGAVGHILDRQETPSHSAP